MKKLLIFTAIFVCLAILIVGVYLVISLLSIGSDSSQTEPFVALQDHADVLAYAKENFEGFEAQYDPANQLLRLIKTTTFSLASAESIYDDTSTYLTQAQIFALDISASCAAPTLTVELCYLSQDGEPMLSIASDGSVTKHWQ